MDALQKAREYLERDPLLYMDMLGPLDRGMVEVVSLREDGLLLYNGPGEAFMLAADSLEAGKALCAGVEAMEIATAHDGETGAFLRDQYHLPDLRGCTQAAYLEKEPLPVPPGFEIRPLGEEFFSLILENYHSFTDPEYIHKRIAAGVMHGAFQKGELLGFIGMHAEGSVGMLEVLPQHRRKGAATALMAFMTGFCLERGWVPFSQIFHGNEASLALHRSLGWALSQRPLYWVMPE